MDCLLDIFYSISLLQSATRFLSGKRTSGVVTQITETQFSGGTVGPSETHINPAIDYNIDGMQYQISPMYSNYLGLYSPGDKVTVIYKEGDPHSAKVLALIGYWINISEIFVAFIVICLISAIVKVYIP